jgi:hypothetical protein
MTTETKKPLSLTEVKAAIKANLGTPQNNANAAKALAGTTFYAENLKGEFVLGTILPELSSKGKVQAVLACCHEEDGVPCTNTHTREQSDWHQSMRCAVHAQAKKAKLTEAEKEANKVAKAKAIIAQFEAKQAATQAE